VSKVLAGKTADWCRLWRRRCGEDNNISKVKMFKLHGSINWKIIRGQITLKDRPYYVRHKHNSPIREKISILPPGWQKEVTANPYNKMWKEARRALDRCRTLIIIGYSLPETDVLAKSLFSEVIRIRVDNEDYLKELHLVDPNKAIKDKLTNLFVSVLGPKGKLVRYEDMKEYCEKNEIIQTKEEQERELAETSD
jgi:hypothetical protein